MFPEGTRHGGKDLLPFKKGAFHVAIASQTLIQPVVVSRYSFLDSTNHTFNSGTIFSRLGSPTVLYLNAKRQTIALTSKRLTPILALDGPTTLLLTIQFNLFKLH